MSGERSVITRVRRPGRRLAAEGARTGIPMPAGDPEELRLTGEDPSVR